MNGNCLHSFVWRAVIRKRRVSMRAEIISGSTRILRKHVRIPVSVLPVVLRIGTGISQSKNIGLPRRCYISRRCIHKSLHVLPIIVEGVPVDGIGLVQWLVSLGRRNSGIEIFSLIN